MAFLNKLSSISKKIEISSFYRFFPYDVIYGLSSIFAQGGYEVSSLQMNTDGNKIVIGMKTSNSSFSSFVKIYSKINEEWVQEGSNIAGPYSFGRGITINSVGNRIAAGDFAAGTTKIYELNNSEWAQLGSTISGAFGFGEALAMNAAGDRVIVGNYRGVTAAVFSWNGSQWTQLGATLSGSGSDQFGFKVAMSADGNIIAISAAYGSFPFPERYRCGYTKIYSWNGSQWTQMGQTIYGSAEKDNLGFGLSMNAAGDRIVLGAHGNYTFFYPDSNQSNLTNGYVRVYSWNAATSTWIQLGTDIFGKRILNDTFGSSVSMNQAGDKIIINDSLSFVYVYHYDGVNWTQRGPSLTSNYAGWASYVGIDGNGDTFAFQSNGTSEKTGSSVKVYQDYFIKNNRNTFNWIKYGDTIYSKNANDQMAGSLSLNSAGNIIAMGSGFNGASAGFARIYSFNGFNWIQLGQDLVGQAVGNGFGHSISLNDAGNIVAIGEESYDASIGNEGAVKFYTYNGSNWISYGSLLFGSSANDRFGTSVSMSGSNNIVVVGAPSAYASVIGYVKVFSYSSGTWSQLGQTINGVASSPTQVQEEKFGSKVLINRAGNRILISAPFHTSSGFVYGGRIASYSYSGGTWSLLGQELYGKDFSENQFGNSIAMDSTGSIIAASALFYVNSQLHSTVRVFSYNGSSWIQLGSSITNPVYQSSFISLNADGKILFVKNEGSLFQGYYYNGSDWIQYWNSATSEIGDVIATNDAGNIVASSRANLNSVNLFKLN